MGYRIVYGKNGKPRFFSQNKRTLPGWVMTLSVVIILGAIILYSGAGRLIRGFFMPHVSDASLTSLADDIKGGENVIDAISAFCSEVVQNAKIAE